MKCCLLLQAAFFFLQYNCTKVVFEMRGRKNKYFTHVQPRLEEIQVMAQTMTEKQIAAALGVGYSTFAKYKVDYKELQEAIKNGRIVLVAELKDTLIKKARGFHYQEKKTIKENGVIIREEIYDKYAQPDTGAAHLLLKNYDETWSNDPALQALKERELELKEKHLENETW